MVLRKLNDMLGFIQIWLFFLFIVYSSSSYEKISCNLVFFPSMIE